MEKNLLNWSKFTPADREEYGTIAEHAGPKGTIGLIQSNILDTTKRVALVLKREDGSSDVVTCSSAVSKGIRDKSISIEQLGAFMMFVQRTDKNGAPVDPYLLVGMSNSATIKEYAIDTTVDAYEPAEVNFDELVAYE